MSCKFRAVMVLEVLMSVKDIYRRKPPSTLLR